MHTRLFPPPRLTPPPITLRIETVGLWRSWERASMAWKRSSVRSRSGPPNNPHPIKQIAEAALPRSPGRFVSTVLDVTIYAEWHTETPPILPKAARRGQPASKYQSSCYDCLHEFTRFPKMAVPMRTQVEPSSMAAAKSLDMPMERPVRLGCWARDSSRRRRSSRK